jgi:hypothetical protein
MRNNTLMSRNSVCLPSGLGIQPRKAGLLDLERLDPPLNLD